MGVDVFFILSGFLVGGLLVKEWQTRGAINGKRFLIRRALKIWPLYYIYLMIMLVTGHRTLHYLRGNLLNIQNYTGGVPHTWSLAVEEHAYLLLTLCLVIASRRRVRMRTLFLVLAIISLGVVVLRIVIATRGDDPDFYNKTHMRIEAILYGVMLAILFRYAPSTFERLQRLWWIWTGALAAGLLYFRLDLQGAAFASLGLDVANFVGIALLMLLYRRGRTRTRSMLYRCVAFIGMYSYGIYLWHVSVIVPVLAVGPFLPSWLVPVWTSFAPPASAILAGILLSRLIEFPALRLRDRLFPGVMDSPVEPFASTLAVAAGQSYVCPP
jgi:peptidoglycan/LPS O-acetylase OafA/YrhL